MEALVEDGKAKLIGSCLYHRSVVHFIVQGLLSCESFARRIKLFDPKAEEASENSEDSSCREPG